MCLTQCGNEVINKFYYILDSGASQCSFDVWKWSWRRLPKWVRALFPLRSPSFAQACEVPVNIILYHQHEFQLTKFRFKLSMNIGMQKMFRMLRFWRVVKDALRNEHGHRYECAKKHHVKAALEINLYSLALRRRSLQALTPVSPANRELWGLSAPMPCWCVLRCQDLRLRQNCRSGTTQRLPSCTL